MANFFSYLRQHKLPERKTLRTFLALPLSWYGLVLYVLLIAIAATSYATIAMFNNTLLVTVPARGGTLSEGIIGTPKFINPILASTDTDKALVSLVYSGILKEQDGSYVPDLAVDYSVSSDQRTYTVHLPQKAKWSDGKPLTSSDIAFTFELLANSSINSNSKYWEPITVETPNDTTALISLPEARSDFLSALTVGILPAHVWEKVADQDFGTTRHNLYPIGSGMFRVTRVRINGASVESITLSRNQHYVGQHPYLSHLEERFYPNQAQLLRALTSESIDMTLAASPNTATLVSQKSYSLEKIASPYNISLYHKKGESILANANLVAILNRAIDKNSLLAKVMDGYGILPSTPIDSPTLSPEDIINDFKSLGYTYKDDFLEKNGQPVGFAIAVENDETALLTAQTLSEELGSVGVLVTVKAFDRGAFSERLNRGDFQVFLASEQTPIPDVYEPVLALYKKAYPFITNTYLHLPDALYSPRERYRYLSEWYVEYDRVWNFLYNKNKNL